MLFCAETLFKKINQSDSLPCEQRSASAPEDEWLMPPAPPLADVRLCYHPTPALTQESLLTWLDNHVTLTERRPPTRTHATYPGGSHISAGRETLTNPTGRSGGRRAAVCKWATLHKLCDISVCDAVSPRNAAPAEILTCQAAGCCQKVWKLTMKFWLW